MTNPPWQRLTHDRLVTIARDDYRFLTKFYMPESVLKSPPSEGWPNITSEATKDFPRSPIEIGLLKHLPYIDEKEIGNNVTNDLKTKFEKLEYVPVPGHGQHEGEIDEDILKVDLFDESLAERDLAKQYKKIYGSFR